MAKRLSSIKAKVAAILKDQRNMNQAVQGELKKLGFKYSSSSGKAKYITSQATDTYVTGGKRYFRVGMSNKGGKFTRYQWLEIEVI